MSLFIKDKISYIIRNDLNRTNEFIERLFVQIPRNILGLSKDAVIGIIYRPRDKDVQAFSKNLEELMIKVHNENKYVYMMGDYNINLLNVDNHLPTSEFLDTLFSYSFYPLINKPTRVKGDSATLIDNIFSNNMDINNLSNGIFYVDISDHFPIFTITSNTRIKPAPVTITRRIFSTNNIDNFVNRLKNVNWLSVLSCDECQSAFTNFHEYMKSFLKERCFSKFYVQSIRLTLSCITVIYIRQKGYIIR